ncbi:MAG TPA: hypothetical protein VG165_08145 [Solirubrobacteraceae bacterium]|nr:hypothetical protein [Solirubrobacteraceae bacterium]
MARHTDGPRRADSAEHGEGSGSPAAPAERRRETDEPDGSDFSLDPAPARSDQLPEDAPEPVAPD